MRSAGLCCMLLAAIAFVGCSHKTTVVTSDGAATVTTSQDNQTTTVQSNNGTLTTGKNAVDPSKLGAPVYPGAEQSQDGGIAVSGNQGSTQMAVFKTTDPFDKVYDYYKSQLPAGSEKMKMSEGSESMATFQIGDDKSPDQTTVMISAKDGATQILITHGLQNKQSN